MNRLAAKGRSARAPGRATASLSKPLFGKPDGRIFSALPLVAFSLSLHAQAVTQHGPVNPLAQEVTKHGILTCAVRVNQVANYLGFGQHSGALLMVQPGGQDQRLFSIEMEIPSPQGHAYVNSVFAPNQLNGCGASYQAIIYWAQKCEDVAKKGFAPFKKSGHLKKEVTILDGGSSTKVFLMPAGTGCISIKNEIVH